MSTATSSTRSLPERFVAKLKELKDSKRVGEMAVLRRNAGLSLAESRGALGLFYRLLPVDIGSQEEIYFLVATLYPLNTRPAQGDNLGAAFAKVKQLGGSDSLDRRMSILLDSDFVRTAGRIEPGELGFRLRQTVKLLAGKEIGIDWDRLLKDLLQWNHPDRWVQKRWARSYFGTLAINEDEEDTSDAS